jgi:hypothetical protein
MFPNIFIKMDDLDQMCVCVCGGGDLYAQF